MIEEAVQAAAGGVETLAEEVGVSYATLRYWMKGERNPSPDNLRRLADVLAQRGANLNRLSRQLKKAAGV